ncbi:MAG: paraquat-inducible protein A, partial [Rhizobiaceae bacterium]|nr:paraquat-inducible protein A [Rhizobiaceae bacterium]
MRRFLPYVLLLATLCFPLGAVLPLVTVERLLIFSDESSLVGIVHGLWDAGDVILATVIALFSLAFPTVKLAFLHHAAYRGGEEAPSFPPWLKALSNWSMLDVVLVALVIFAAKTSGLANAFAKPGLWF